MINFFSVFNADAYPLSYVEVTFSSNKFNVLFVIIGEHKQSSSKSMIINLCC